GSIREAPGVRAGGSRRCVEPTPPGRVRTHLRQLSEKGRIRGRGREGFRHRAHLPSRARIPISRAFIMTVLDVRAVSVSESGLRPAGGGARGLIGWVCTSNPFYVLSALLVCVGLWVSFGSQAFASQTWALLIGMAGYTLLLAVTACFLVRYVGVWDDVRTV